MAVVPVSSGNTARHHLLLQDFRPDGLAATPSFALHLAESLRAAGGRPETLGLRYGMFGAEPWTEGMRTALERAWGCPAYDVYGLSEIIGPGVAGECEARDGLHVADDHFLPEIVDPATGAPRREGEEGELVVTTLTKRALPLVRYRTGDITALATAPCRCGRTSARIARLKGRADDMLVIKGVNVYPSEVEAALLTIADLEPHYQLVVDRSATLARVEVHVEPAPAVIARCGGRWAEGHPEVEALRRQVGDRLRVTIGLSVDVRLVPPQSIARSEGKAVRVVSR
jgi:phenylacetate-CoA ligase